MITLRLQGSLAAHVRDRLDDEARRRSKPGEAVLELDARSVTEAMRLVAGQAEGMDWELRIRSWRVTVNGSLVGQNELDMRLPDRAYVSVAPVLAGDGPTIPLWGKVLIAVGGAIAAGEYLASQIPSIPDTEHLETGQRRTLFSGPVNSIAQGGAVPLIYGRTRVGSTVVSGGITQERPTGGEHAAPDDLSLGGWRPPGAERPGRLDRGRDSEIDRNPVTGGGGASQERSVLRVVDLLGEGEIEGLVDGLKSVFIDGVAVEDADGNRNVEGVSIQERKGLAHNATGQEALTGFDATSTGLTHSREKIVHGTPQVGTVPASYDAARVTLQFPVLVEYDEHGNEIATDVHIKIEAGRSGSWTTVLTQTISDLSLEQQEVSWRVDRPEAVTDSQTWQVRVSRLTPDSTSTKVRDDVYWQRFAGLRDVKQTYPHSAVIGLVIETDRADSVNVARREYEVKGRKVLVPPASIYDPSRTTATSAARYGSGVWDGTMRRLWTDNPAWIAYDALTDRRAGLGGIPGMVEAVRGARAFFLELSRHCDVLVPAPDSDTDMEPRWRFNGTIQRREQARRVIDWLLSACRAGISWSAGAAALSIDGESDVVASIGNANVVDGDFEYQGLRWQERYSAAAVTWQDPEDEYRSGIELVVSDDLVAKYGHRQKDVAAIGCTSRGQAHRTGLLVLNEQERESETVKFRMALEGMHLRPGDRIQIADQQRFEVRAAFRVRIVDTSTAGRETITLDSPSPRLAAGGTIAFGEGETAGVTQAADESADVLVTPDVPTGLVPGDLVVNDAAVIDWIVTELQERDQLEAVLTARRHDPNKYTSIELRRMLSPPLLDPVAAILAPAAVRLVERTYEDGNLVRSQLEIAARESLPFDHRIVQLEYQIGADGGPWMPLRFTVSRSLVLKGHDSPVPLVVGQRIKVRARFLGRRRKSPWTESVVLELDGKTDALAAPEGLAVTARYEGYWVYWTRPDAHDYDLTEVWQRSGNPGAADEDVDLTEDGWVQVGEIRGVGFLQTGVEGTDPLRVAIRHRDTSGLHSPAREVGVTPLALDAAAGEDGQGVEYVFRVTGTQAEPSAPDNTRVYDPETEPGDGFTDGLTGLSASTPWGHRWSRGVPGTPAPGTSPPSTLPNNGWTAWRYDGPVARWGQNGLDGVDGADGADGQGVEYVFRPTNSAAAPSVPANTRAYDPTTDPGDGFTDGLAVTSTNPFGHRWSRSVPGSPAQDTSPPTTLPSGGWTAWQYDGIVAHYGRDGQRGLPGLDGQDGQPGAAGVAVEYIFAVSSSSSLPNNQKPSNSWGYESGGMAGGLQWTDAGQGVSSTARFLYRAEREIAGRPTRGAAVSDDWSEPVIVGVHGQDGVPGADGADGEAAQGREYIFARVAATVANNQRPDNAWGYESPGTVNGLTWTDAAPDLTQALPVLVRCERRVTGTPADGAAVSDQWTAPVIVGRYGQDPSPQPTAVTSSITIDDSNAGDPVSIWSAGLTRPSSDLGAALETVQRFSDGRVQKFTRLIAHDSAAWVNNVFTERALTRSDRSTGTNGATLAVVECYVMTTRGVAGKTFRSGPVLTVATSGAGGATGVAPTVPQGFGGTNGDRQTVVTWQPPVRWGGGRNRRYVGASRVQSGAWPADTDLGNVTQTTIRNLTNGTTYELRIKAVTDAGESGYVYATVTPSGTIADSAAPPGSFTVTVGDGTGNNVTVSWTDPTGTTPMTFRVRWRRGSTGDWTEASSAATKPLTVDLTGSSDGLHTFEVQAKNAGGSRTETATVNVSGITDGDDDDDDDDDPPTAVEEPPGVPAGFSLTAGDHKITIAAQEPADWGTGTNRRFRATYGTVANLLNSAGPTWAADGVTNGVITGLDNGTTYFVVVQAITEHGGSPVTAWQRATPMGAGATAPSVPRSVRSIRDTTPGREVLTVLWSPPSSWGTGTAASRKFEYRVKISSMSFGVIGQVDDTVRSVTLNHFLNPAGTVYQVRAVTDDGQSAWVEVTT